MERLRLRTIYILNEKNSFVKRQNEKSTPLHISPMDMAKVTRNLFGSVDPEENRKIVMEHMNNLDQINREKWNFDFMKEEPVNAKEGFYQWESTHKKPQHTVAPKPRRPGQQKIHDYLPQVKSGEGAHKKLKLILDSLKDDDQDQMKISNQ